MKNKQARHPKLRNSVARFSDLPKQKWSFAKSCMVYDGTWAPPVLRVPIAEPIPDWVAAYRL